MNPKELPPTTGPSPPEEVQRGLMARFRNYFLTGLIVAGPIAITLYLTWWFVTWVDGLVRPFVPVAYRAETYLPWWSPWPGRPAGSRAAGGGGCVLPGAAERRLPAGDSYPTGKQQEDSGADAYRGGCLIC